MAFVVQWWGWYLREPVLQSIQLVYHVYHLIIPLPLRKEAAPILPQVPGVHRGVIGSIHGEFLGIDWLHRWSCETKVWIGLHTGMDHRWSCCVGWILCCCATDRRLLEKTIDP
jgi:hypothetical protein